ncbi:MAG: ABC transporter permease [Spirochaetota bacterium]|nr:ABC transporter permease [Spirochaetota bacterium]
MGYLIDGIIQAFQLLIGFDEETFSAIFATLKASSLSITFSLLIGIPAGFFLGYLDFPGKRQLRVLVDTLLALPTVVVGLLVYAFISRSGPCGDYNLLFTLPGIAIAQCLLVIPIVIALTATAVESLDRRLRITLLTLGADARQVAIDSLLEARYAVLGAAIAAYGRAISEVGISMMIGGNIKWYTRTITTAIAMETGKGEFAMGIALGMVLLLLAFSINWSLIILKNKS